MLDSRRRTKIKNDKVQVWRMELAPFLYIIRHRPGQRNVATDTFTPAYYSATNVASFTSSCVLQNIHDRLCHPGVIRILHFMKSKNLVYSTSRELFQRAKYVLALNVYLFEEIMDFNQGNAPYAIGKYRFQGSVTIIYSPEILYLFIVFDEYSRFPFTFPCKDMTTSTAIKCLD